MRDRTTTRDRVVRGRTAVLLGSALLAAAAVSGIVGCGNGGKGVTGGGGGGGAMATRLRGGGASFIYPAMSKWKSVYNEEKKAEIDYQSLGSGAGVQQMTARTLDFGCTDAPMKKEQLERAREEGGEVVHVPLVIGAVVAAYNLPGNEKPLNFSGEILAGIYLGKIKKWNDPALQAANQGVNLPDLDVVPVYRADASGTTNIFTEFLSKSSAEFKEKVGTSTAPTWPKGVGTGARDSVGVAGETGRNPGRICYVELDFAKKNNLKYGAVRNKAGKVVEPLPENVTAAAEAAMKVKPDKEPYSLNDLTWSLTDADGEKSYPIVGMTYAVFFKQQPPEKGRRLLDFIRWCVRDGQKLSTELNYAPLPEDLVKRIEAKFNEVELK
jgi:phosphate transport system substrate-binding protein